MTDKPLPVPAAPQVRDVLDRVEKARQVATGTDTLRRPLDGMDERFGFAADSRYLKD